MVMEKFNGPAHLTDICVLAKFYIGDNTIAKDVRNNIRRVLNSNPDLFCHVEGMPDGWWQSTSRRDEICGLKALLAEKDLRIDNLMKVVREDDFLERLIEKLSTLWKDDKRTLGEIRKILVAVGRSDYVEKLDAKLERKTKKRVTDTASKIVVNGDYVVEKKVDQQIGTIEDGGIGVKADNDKEK